MTAFGYIRKSVFHGEEATADLNMQKDAIAALAASFKGASDDLVVLQELDVSGRRGRDQRPRWDEILTAIESGEATHVFAYSLSRFTRSLKDLATFRETCEKHGVLFATAKEKIDTSNAMGRAMFSMVGVINELESDLASERQKDKRQADIAAGTYRGGGRPYGKTWEKRDKEGNLIRVVGEGEDLDAVITAYRETGSFLRAARALQADGVPTRNGASRGWTPVAVQAIIKRAAPELMKDPATRPVRGSRDTGVTHRFARLLRCSVCGSLLTPSIEGRTGSVRYACHKASIVAGHGRTLVSEPALIKAMTPVAEEIAFRVQKQRRGTEADEQALAAIEAERARINAMFKKGRIDEDEYDSDMARLDTEAEGYAAMRRVRVITIPPDIATDDSAKVNGYLRTVFERVTVDMATAAPRGPVQPAIAVDPTWRIRSGYERVMEA